LLIFVFYKNLTQYSWKTEKLHPSSNWTLRRQRRRREGERKRGGERERKGERERER
jgi:hypothetical protein